MEHPAVGRHAAGLHTVELDGSLTVFDRSSGRVASLNPTASEVWRAVGDGATVDSIASDLAARHRVPVAGILADVAAAVADLRSAGLLVD